jgi:hypothetical protein
VNARILALVEQWRVAMPAPVPKPVTNEASRARRATTGSHAIPS